MPEVSVSAPEGTLPAWAAGFGCVSSRRNGTVTVAVSGELDIATSPELERTIRVGEPSSDVVILDLREVEFIDSSGLHLIVAANERIRRAGGRLLVVRGPSAVQRIFAISGVDRELELIDVPPAASAPS